MGISSLTADNFKSAINFFLRRDPLVLDLDGDGIETVGASANIMFDHDGDGNLNGTGWVKADDGFLVLDRNANGTIDNGSELFGVDTVLANGQKAANGFAALSDLDTNSDGIFSAADTQFANVRIWRDLNQDGVSQANELMSLQNSGIASINLNATASGSNQGNGNVVTMTSTYTRTDGTTRTVGSMDFGQDTFNSSFSDYIEPTEQTADLPFMYGSGQVRDLREAATLSSDLASTITNLSASGETRSQMLAALDTLITQWSDTSTMDTSVETVDDRGVKLIYLAPGQSSAAYAPFMGEFADYIMGNTSSADLSGLSEANRLTVESLRTQQMQISNQMEILEHFNGNTFIRISETGTEFRTGAGALLTVITVDSDTQACYVPLDTVQTSFLSQAYTALKESVYAGLVTQTRLATYFDDIIMEQNGDTFSWDCSNLTARLEYSKQTDASNAYIDLIELNRYAGLSLYGLGWDGMSLLRTWVIDAQGNSTLQSVLTQFNVQMGSGVINGSTKDDFIFGQSGNDTLYGDAGNDVFVGGAGNDQLFGGAGDDVLEGSAGVDYLVGEAGNDTYLFGLGEGQDWINNWDTGYATSTDVLQLKSGITSDMVTLERRRNSVSDPVDSLIVKINETSDQVLVWGFFENDSASKNGIDAIRFADGTTWNVAAILQKVLNPTAGNDTLPGYVAADAIDGLGGNDVIYGYGGNDTLSGSAGDDTLYGGDGNDILDGGDGIDYLYGENGNDTLTGGAGNDQLFGDAGDDVLEGGAGVDYLVGEAGNDTYLFGQGEGQDWINNWDMGYATSTDVLQLKSGITPDMVTLERRRNSVSDPVDSLIVKINGTSDQVLVWGFFENDSASKNGIDAIRFADGTTWNVAAILQKVLNPTAGNDTLPGYVAADAIDGLGGNDVIYGYGGNDTLSGSVGDDTLYGDVGNDVLVGGVGNDQLFGDVGDDVLEGGAGVDYLVGEAGNDTYLFGQGEGQDWINNWDMGYATSTDVLQLKSGITPDMVTLERKRNSVSDPVDSLIVKINGTSDQVLVWGFFENDSASKNGIDAIRFADGTTWNVAAILQKVLNPTAGNDTLPGYAAADAIDGLGGNDVIYGYGGNDTLSGSAGDDVLYGGEGNDILDGGDGIDYLYGENGNDTLTGDAGNDQLFGDVGDDVLEGGAGVDYLVGEAGNDTYLFGQGEGQDWINNWDMGYATSTDVLQLKSGITPDMVTLERKRNSVSDPVDSLIVKINGTSDQVLVWGFFQNDSASKNGIDAIRFADGATWNVAAILQKVLNGTAGNDTLSGYATADAIDGLDGNDVIYGYGGNDTLSGSAGSDTLYGGEGNDILDGGDGIDYLYGENGNDTLTGGAGNDQLFGDAGDDVLEGGAGVDYLVGEAGNDTYLFGQGEGQDWINNWDMGYATSTDVLELKSGITPDMVMLERRRNSVSDPVDTLIVKINGTSDQVLVWGFFENNGASKNGIDAIRFADGTTWNVAAIMARATIMGTTGNDLLNGTANNDTIDGGVGADTMVGGAGNDAYIVDNTGDVITENANEGTDAVFSSITYTLGNNIENLTLAGTSAINGTGNTLNNILTGNSANNTLNGSSGADTMIGGTGNDVYVVDNTGDVVTENLNEGTDTVQSSITYVLSDNVENLTLAGTSAINGTGNTLNNILTGNSADNILDGGAGADTMIGGAGNDTYIVDNAGDVLVENVNEGTDAVQSSVTYTLGANIENLTLTGSLAINATGNTLNNILTGNSANNTLSGGAGADSMIGGVGNDVYVVDNIGDVVIENVSEGTDTVQSSIIYTLGDNVEKLTLTGSSAINGTGNTLDNYLTGNSAANTLTGGAGNDTLSGGTGADTLIGGIGNDVYVVDNIGDVVIENVSEGTDTVQSSIIYTLGDNVEKLTLTGSSAINGTGNTLDNYLTGNSAANTLTGGAGNDTLSGGTGADTLIGGIGNDVYVVDNIGDVVIENVSEGTDTVQSSVTYTLSNNVENLTLTGSSAISATGNTLDNYLTGNSAANTLTGGAGNDTLLGGTGADTMIGGIGNDVYVVDNIGDVVIENANEGTDTVQSSVTYTLSNNVENLTLTGSSAINATGNTLDNVLTGNSGNNSLTGYAGNDTLDGGSGSDTMLGGTGDDVYVVNSTGDVVTENVNEGIDTVQSSITYTLGANVENLTLTGTSALNSTGNTLDNYLTGNSGTNNLSGAAGNDTLTGGAGNDTLDGGAGSDTYQFGNGSGQDVINNNDSVTTNIDAARFLDATNQNLWFSRSGNNLIVTVAGTTDQVSINNWYSSSSYQLDKFNTSGYVLQNAMVDQLVNAMSSYAVPYGAGNIIPQNVQDELAPVLAATWQSGT